MPARGTGLRSTTAAQGCARDPRRSSTATWSTTAASGTRSSVWGLPPSEEGFRPRLGKARGPLSRPPPQLRILPPLCLSRNPPQSSERIRPVFRR